MAGGCGVALGKAHDTASVRGAGGVGVTAGIRTGVAHVRLAGSQTYDFTPLELGAYVDVVAHVTDRLGITVGGDATELDGHGWQIFSHGALLGASYTATEQADVFIGIGYGGGHTGAHVESLDFTAYSAAAGVDVELGTLGVPVMLRVEATASTGESFALQAVDGSLVFGFWR